MFAKVTTEFPGKPDNEILSRTIAVGETISGELAVIAVREKWAAEVPPSGSTAPKLELSAMTIEALKALAAQNDIDLGDATKKADIIAAIQLAEEGK